MCPANALVLTASGDPLQDRDRSDATSKSIDATAPDRAKHDTGVETLLMSSDDTRSRLELIAAELRAVGITLKRLPGEYCVNFLYGGEGTARMADDLDKALEFGRAMAEERAAARATAKKPCRRRRGRRMSSKSQRRRFTRRRNRRGPRRALRRQRGNI